MWSCSSGQRIPCFESCQLPITWMSIMTSGFPMESKGIRLDSSRRYWTTLVYYQVKCMLQSLKNVTFYIGLPAVQTDKIFLVV